MRLFRLTFATIVHRKAWVLCLFAVVVLPFVLPMVSAATEKTHLVQPARIQTAWAALWICTLVWGLFTAAQQGEANVRSGLGEYFFTTGITPVRQLLATWLAVACFIVPLVLGAAAVSLFGAMPGDPGERGMWWALNFQYASLFILVTLPLLALAVALSSRFGGVAGFSITLALALYGLYGVGYIDNLLKQEHSVVLQGLWLFSPQYRYADLTQRLYFKTGAFPASIYLSMLVYYTAIMAVIFAISWIAFRIKPVN